MSYTPHTRDQALTLVMATLGTDAQPTAAMAARVREARVMLLPCQECGELHAAARLDGSTGLCEKCYDLAGMENEHSDGHHTGNPNPECPDCRPAEAKPRARSMRESVFDPEGGYDTGKPIFPDRLPQRHDCEVKTMYPDRVHAAYQVVCDICGKVNLMHPYKVDAEAIAVRHFEQGGFERRGA